MQNPDKLRVAYIAAGAAGMICGSCLRDNALITALQKLGCDAVLIPTYTPLRLDEEDVSLNQVFFGGINVFLQQKSALFRRLPRSLGRALDHPALLKRVAAGNLQTEARLLGDLALSMLRGIDGFQAKEVERLVDFLGNSVRPDLVNLTNVLIAGVVPAMKSRLGVPVVATLQGDDAFLDQLEEPHRKRVLDKIREIVPLVDGFIVFSRHYGEEMSRMLHIPAGRIFRVPLGLNTDGFPARAGRSGTSRGVKRIGYLARVCPEKGFDVLVESFIHLKSREGMESVQLHAGGWLGESHRPFSSSRLTESGRRAWRGLFSITGCWIEYRSWSFSAPWMCSAFPRSPGRPRGSMFWRHWPAVFLLWSRITAPFRNSLSAREEVSSSRPVIRASWLPL